MSDGLQQVIMAIRDDPLGPMDSVIMTCDWGWIPFQWLLWFAED